MASTETTSVKIERSQIAQHCQAVRAYLNLASVDSYRDPTRALESIDKARAELFTMSQTVQEYIEKGPANG